MLGFPSGLTDVAGSCDILEVFSVVDDNSAYFLVTRPLVISVDDGLLEGPVDKAELEVLVRFIFDRTLADAIVEEYLALGETRLVTVDEQVRRGEVQLFGAVGVARH